MTTLLLLSNFIQAVHTPLVDAVMFLFSIVGDIGIVCFLLALGIILRPKKQRHGWSLPVAGNFLNALQGKNHIGPHHL